MPSRDDDAGFLVQIACDIGETREGVNNLKENVNILADDVREIRDKLSKTVRQDECTQRHVAVASGLKELKQELITEFKRSTGGGYPKITPEMVKEQEEKRVEEAQEKKRKSLQFWIWVASTAFVFVSTVVIGSWKVFTWVTDIKTAVATSQKEIKRSIKTVSETPKIVYVNSVVPVDSGVDGLIKKIDKKIGKSSRVKTFE